MAPESQQQKQVAELLSALVERKLISAPQMQMLLADSEATGMNVEDVLIARRWVSDETLYSIAPWMKDRPATSRSASEPAPEEHRTEAAALDASVSGSDDFEENLRKYRELMDSILGESNK